MLDKIHTIMKDPQCLLIVQSIGMGMTLIFFYFSCCFCVYTIAQKSIGNAYDLNVVKRLDAIDKSIVLINEQEANLKGQIMPSAFKGYPTTSKKGTYGN